MNFVDNQSDINTINFLSKSIPMETMEKALDRTGLVQKEVQYKTSTGKIATRKQWVKEGEEQTAVKPPKKQPRPQVEATDHNITEKTAHLKPLQEGEKLPDYFTGEHAVPPNWRKVMYSPDPNANLLAIGKDGQNRTVYLYHKDFVASKSNEKFSRVRNLMKNRDNILNSIKKLKESNPEVSDCLNLIFHMGTRPGSTADTKSVKEARGATTLKGENVVVEGDNVYLDFTGKKGVAQRHKVTDSYLKTMLVQRKEKAGDNGDLFNTTDDQLRKALKPLGLHPKDLRTMLATHMAEQMLKDLPVANNAKEMTKLRNQVGDKVCSVLGNQRTMALNSYIDPEVFIAHSPDGMSDWKSNQAKKKVK